MNLIKDYIFNSDSQMVLKLKDLKANTLKELKGLRKRCNNEIISGKVDKVYKNVLTLDENIVNDESLSRFMLVSRLKEEILEDKKDER